jgi:hypothetical protein
MKKFLITLAVFIIFWGAVGFIALLHYFLPWTLTVIAVTLALLAVFWVFYSIVSGWIDRRHA